MTLPFVVEGDGDGPKLVFAHGLMATGAAQRVQLAPLVDAGWTIATFDQRGHGAAPPVTDPSRYDPVAMGEDLWAVADAAGFDRCWVGGGSMGAATSFCAVSSRPERVLGHISAVPALRDTPHAAIFMFDALADQVRDAGVEGLIEALRRWSEQIGRDQTDEIFVEQLRTHDAASLECALRSVPRWILPGVPSAFADFPFPVLVVGWEDDPIHPMQTARDVAAAANIDVLELDQTAVLGDRTLFGRALSDALLKVSA